MYQATLNHFDFGSANTSKHNTTNFSALLTGYDSCLPVFDKWDRQLPLTQKKQSLRKGYFPYSTHTSHSTDF